MRVVSLSLIVGYLMALMDESDHATQVQEGSGMSQYLENKIYEDIAVGHTASVSRELRQDDIETWAAITGNLNQIFNYADADAARLEEGGATGMWGAALLSTLIGMKLPGLGSVVKATDIRFHRKIAVGMHVTATVTVSEKRDDGHILLECQCVDRTGAQLLSGTALVLAPKQRVRQRIEQLPTVHLRHEDRYLELVAMCDGLDPMNTAVVHPCSTDALEGALQAAEKNLIRPILIGPAAKIQATADAAGVDISGFEVIDADHSHHAAELGVGLVRSGDASTIMKGSLHTDELLHEVLRKDAGLRTERRLSHVFALSVATYARPIILTDAAINIAPDLLVKRDIVQNAIEVAHAVGLHEPKVAILAAVETINPAMSATLDAAALCKMADRGQIKGGVLDGPLAFDNAVDEQAAQTKGITSPVAGRADILVAPDLEAGNMLAKQLTFMAEADAAGLLVGARVPIILTSRADGARTRLASAALAVLVADAQRRGLAMLKAAE